MTSHKRIQNRTTTSASISQSSHASHGGPKARLAQPSSVEHGEARLHVAHAQPWNRQQRSGVQYGQLRVQVFTQVSMVPYSKSPSMVPKRKKHVASSPRFRNHTMDCGSPFQLLPADLLSKLTPMVSSTTTRICS